MRTLRAVVLLTLCVSVPAFAQAPSAPPGRSSEEGLPLIRTYAPADGPYDARMVVVQPGECIVLCSDGVIDAQDEAGDEFGEDHLAEIVSTHRDAPATAIVIT